VAAGVVGVSDLSVWRFPAVLLSQQGPAVLVNSPTGWRHGREGKGQTSVVPHFSFSARHSLAPGFGLGLVGLLGLKREN